MKRNITHVLCVLIFLSAVSGSGWAAHIELEPARIDLVTSFSQFTEQRGFENSMPTPNVSVEGPYRINLKGIGEKKELEINFRAVNPEVYTLMANQLAFQYCIQVGSEPGPWSEWKSLNQLPLKISLRDQSSNSLTNPQVSNHSPEEIVVMLRLRVPQAPELRQGVYEGEFIFQVS